MPLMNNEASLMLHAFFMLTVGEDETGWFLNYSFGRAAVGDRLWEMKVAMNGSDDPTVPGSSSWKKNAWERLSSLQKNPPKPPPPAAEQPG